MKHFSALIFAAATVAIAAVSCVEMYYETPNLDRLVRSGTAFNQTAGPKQ